MCFLGACTVLLRSRCAPEASRPLAPPRRSGRGALTPRVSPLGLEEGSSQNSEPHATSLRDPPGDGQGYALTPLPLGLFILRASSHAAPRQSTPTERSPKADRPEG